MVFLENGFETWAIEKCAWKTRNSGKTHRIDPGIAAGEEGRGDALLGYGPSEEGERSGDGAAHDSSNQQETRAQKKQDGERESQAQIRHVGDAFRAVVIGRRVQATDRLSGKVRPVAGGSGSPAASVSIRVSMRKACAAKFAPIFTPAPPLAPSPIPSRG